MERASKILVVLFAGGVVYLFWSAFFYSAEGAKFETHAVQGSSMFPTFKDGELVKVDPQAVPVPGDIVFFDCLSIRCGERTDPFVKPGQKPFSLVKRLDHMEGNCYYFLGDNRENSFDSRSFGALCKGELEILGVVSNRLPLFDK